MSDLGAYWSIETGPGSSSSPKTSLATQNVIRIRKELLRKDSLPVRAPPICKDAGSLAVALVVVVHGHARRSGLNFGRCDMEHQNALFIGMPSRILCIKKVSMAS